MAGATTVNDRDQGPSQADAAASVTLILMGVSGVGKSTVMTALTGLVDASFGEGDDFHPPANVRKMAAGIAITDEDRWPWLRSIAAWIGAREAETRDAVITCSALRRRYRDLLREGHPSVHFVHLTISPPVIERRLAARTGHYMPASLLSSQLATLEPLAPDEPGFEILADRPAADLAASIARQMAEWASRVSGPRIRR